jgi:RNA polymerase sigma-32 factor
MIPEDGLTRYLQRIRDFPMLGEAEERELVRRWREEADGRALRRLAGSHLRMVARMAMDNRGYGLPVAELISEGHVGLMQAIEKFDPERGFRLSTYARWWIRAAMQDYILRNWSLVKTGTTAAQKKLFFNLRRLKHQIRAIEEGDLSPRTVQAIAEELGVPEADVVDMNRRLTGPDLSLNATVSAEEDTQWLDWLVSDEEGQEAGLAAREERDQRRRMLGDAMRQLDPRERHILTERRLRDDPLTLERLSEHYNISRERVRQLEVRAFDKVRKAMHKAAASLPDAHLVAA